ncbi:hypothetical protein ABZ897_08490 [Nonomuraea sp. NPDC046802]|uniref:hypothetical protein n=1 Tax=Nonomuraea sp. NPDC046802 TaxID=3154919 RepID=UPI0033F02561
MKKFGQALAFGLIVVVLLAAYAGVLMLVSFIIRWDLEHAVSFGLMGLVSLGAAIFLMHRSSRKEDNK